MRTALDDPVAVSLIGRLDAELSAMYPEPGANHFTLTGEQVTDGQGGFFVAHLDGVAAGCGAYRMIEPGTAEIKRMFVDPEARGAKVGAALLDSLEAAAVADGAARIVLETGTRQTAALGLYERFGFAPVPAWGEYRDSPTSVCLGKATPR